MKTKPRIQICSESDIKRTATRETVFEAAARVRLIMSNGRRARRSERCYPTSTLLTSGFNYNATKRDISAASLSSRDNKIDVLANECSNILHNTCWLACLLASTPPFIPHTTVTQTALRSSSSTLNWRFNTCSAAEAAMSSAVGFPLGRLHSTGSSTLRDSHCTAPAQKNKSPRVVPSECCVL